MRTLAVLAGLAAALGCAPAPALRIESRDRSSDGFDPAEVPREFLASSGGRLRWVGVLGDRRLRGTHGGFAVDPRGRWLLSLTEDYRTLAVWDAATWRRVHVLRGHREIVSALAIGPAGLAASASWDGTISLWDLDEGTRLRELLGHGVSVESVAFGASGRLYSLDRLGRVFVWDTRNGSLLARGGERPLASTDLALAPDESWYAIGTRRYWDEDDVVLVLDARTGAMRARLEEGARTVDAVAASPDGRRLASAGDEDGSILVWDVETARLERRLEGHEAAVTSLAFDASGGRIASASPDGSVRVWNVASGECVHVLESFAGAPDRLVWSAGGDALFTGGRDGLRMWDPVAGREADPRAGHGSPCATVAGPAGDRIATVGRDRTVRVWDVRTAREVVVLGPLPCDVEWAGWLPDGRTLAAVTEDAKVFTFDSARDWNPTTHRIATRCLHGARPLPDGRRLAAHGYDGEIGIVDLRAGSYRLLSRRDRGCLCGPAFEAAPNGLEVAISDGDGLVLVSVETGEIRLRIAGHRGGVGALRFTPDGARLVTSSEYAIHGSVGPDGGGTTVRVFDPFLRLWNVRDGSLVRTIGPHEDGVCEIALSPDGRWVASATGDGVFHVWDLSTGVEMERIPLASGPSSLLWSGDDLWLGTVEGTVFRFRFDPPGA